MAKRVHLAFRTHRADTPYAGTWEQNQERTYTKGLEATPEQRLAWLEAAMELAHATGALARRKRQITG